MENQLAVLSDDHVRVEENPAFIRDPYVNRDLLQIRLPKKKLTRKDMATLTIHDYYRKVRNSRHWWYRTNGK